MSEPAPIPPVSGPLPVPRRSWVKTAALGTVVLLAGMVIGSGLTVIGIRHWFTQMRDRPEIFSERILAKMQRDLNLTGQQKTEIAKIFKDAREDVEEVRQRHRAQNQAFFRDVHDKIAQVLTPSQQKNWDEWWRKARERALPVNAGPGGQNRQGTKVGGPEKDRKPRFRTDLIEPTGPAASRPAPEFQKEAPPNGIPEHRFSNDRAAPGPETPQEVRRVPSPSAP